jgi:hypothetical protein
VPFDALVTLEVVGVLMAWPAPHRLSVTLDQPS